jgi:hypothetical protein
MFDALGAAVVMLGIDPIAPSAAGEARSAVERELGRRLPGSVARLLHFPGVMEAVASTYTSDVVFPASLQFLDGNRMPGAGNDLLWLMTENQGVCHWGVPLGAGDDPPVIVGGDLEGGKASTEYANSIGEFVLAMAWDKRSMSHESIIQAQADPIDDQTLGLLGSRCSERVKTLGWPGRENRRYEGQDGLLLSIWSGARQCDWWIVADQAAAVERALSWLRLQSNLEQALWSNDEPGMQLLARLGLRGPWSHGPTHDQRKV